MTDDREDHVTRLTSITGGGLVRGNEIASSSFEERFVPLGTLGRGGMGEVILCEDKSIGREVALKVIREEHRDSADHRVRFLREACIQGRLEHPAIVPIHDLGHSEVLGSYFLMKRVHGSTLRDVLTALRNGDPETSAKFTRSKLIAAFRQLCLAIDYAHAHGVVHRDLKPSNVMLGDFGEVHVLDWGLAKRLGGEGDPELTFRGVVMGTPGYMAPEQREDAVDVDPRTDVYALGAILYEILTLRPLAPRASDRGDEPTVPVPQPTDSTLLGDGTLTPELATICLTATRVDPSQRYGSVHELVEAVDRYLGGDRDLELRRSLAEQEAEVATGVVARALERDEKTEEDDRAEAMRRVTRALALDPENVTARRALARLMLNPPARLPEAAVEKMRESQRRVRQLGARSGFVTLLLLGMVFVPLLLNMGVRDWRIATLYLVLHGVMILGAASDGWSTRAHYLPIRLSIALIGFGVASRLFGPLIALPSVASGFLISMMFHARRDEAIAMMSLTVLCLLTPIGLEYAGILPRSYSFTGDAMHVHAHLAQLHEAPTMLFLVAIAILSAVIPASIHWRVRRALDDAQAALALRAWYLDATYEGEAAGSSSAKLRAK